ncbi:MAG TPA: ABC transporter ATP-binding protein [Methylomirabilota bacterium]|nr:ABC transporter ATP-binding protein [Methylomirabilota bacterium]
MHRLWRYIVRYRARYLRGILCLVASATLAMSIPLLLKHAVEAIEHGASSQQLSLSVLAIVGVAVVQGVVRSFSRFLIFNVGRDIEYELRNDLFSHLQTLSLSYYQSQLTGDLMSRLVNDVTAVRMLLGLGIINILNTPLYYAYAVSAMVTIDLRLTVAALSLYPFMLFTVKKMSRQIMDKTLKVQAGLADLSSRVQESVSGIHVIRAYVREDWQNAEFARLNDVFKAESMALAQVRGLFQPLMKGVSGLGLLVVLWYGGSHVIAGRLSIGDLVAFMGYLHLLAWPTMALGWLISIFQRGKAALKRLEAVFQAQPEIVGGQGDGLARKIRGEIGFHHVDFAYHAKENGHQVLSDINFTVPAGSTVAIVGRMGAGKTTLVNLLPRLYDVTSGSITIDGQDIRTVSLTALRSWIGFVPQDPFLFSSRLRDNIAFALPRLDEDRVRWAAHVAHLARDVEDFPRGYDTVVGERGMMLSGGQKQRLTLARALAADPPILVLDDALSSVDTQTEKAILHALRETTQGKTVIVISHRISAVRDADFIVVLDEGRIVEMGAHEDLVEQGGVYTEIFQQQTLEEELAEL